MTAGVPPSPRFHDGPRVARRLHLRVTMQRISPCPACGLPFGDDWVELASSARNAEARTYLCPRCTMGRTISAGAGDLNAQYATRLGPGQASSALEELDDGTLAGPSPAWNASIQARRISDVERALASVKTARTPQLLHVGCLDGRFLARVGEKLDIEVAGMEPAPMAAEDAQRIGIPVCTAPLAVADADLPPELVFEMIVEHHLLEHLDNPRAHLRILKRRLAPGGVAIIEVPNLLRAQGRLESQFLHTNHPNVFTPRALATMCRRAGLEPFHIENGDDLRIFCKHADPDAREVFDGPDARAVAAAVWANDLRIGLKRGLARRGCTEDMMQVAERIHSRSRCQGGRADIAIEIAVALERENRLPEAAHWLQKSLEDRKDGEISMMLVRIETILRHHQPANTSPAVMAANIEGPMQRSEPRAVVN